MTAIIIISLFIIFALIGATDKPKTEEELQKIVYKNSTQEVTIGKILLMLLFK